MPRRVTLGADAHVARQETGLKVAVALEWFLNPDHLPFIAGIERGEFADAGLDVTLTEPDDHYDGLAATAAGEIAFACNEPLHMVDAARPGLKALGCFFETQGGILLWPESGERLLRGDSIRLASPVAGEVTDAIAIDILRRWSTRQNGAFRDAQVRIESAGFEHVKNLQAGYDGAWLCFANFEGVEAAHLGKPMHFISTSDVGLENFSALELFTGEAFLRRYPDEVGRFTEVVSRGAAYCRQEPRAARELWYAYTGESPDTLMDAIIADTCGRLVSPVRRDADRWRAMWRQFRDMGLSQVDGEGFDALYSD